jgi:hypothetical protein
MQRKLDKNCAEWVRRARERDAMFATIQLSPYIHVQGLIVRRLPGGAVAIRVAGRELVGPPLSAVMGLAPIDQAQAVQG